LTRDPQERLEHDPEKWTPVFRKDHAKIKEIERDDDSKKSHRALGQSSLSLPQPRQSSLLYFSQGTDLPLPRN
jgi:hypothetical protein